MIKKITLVLTLLSAHTTQSMARSCVQATQRSVWALWGTLKNLCAAPPITIDLHGTTLTLTRKDKTQIILEGVVQVGQDEYTIPVTTNAALDDNTITLSAGALAHLCAETHVRFGIYGHATTLRLVSNEGITKLEGAEYFI